MAIAFRAVTPILRILDIPKADEFYLGFLDFHIDWDHRFDDDAPLYRQISRGSLVLHLSEHHGDGIPGAHIRIATDDVLALQTALLAKQYRYMRPGLKRTPWDTHECSVLDPFGNKLVFFEPAVSERRDTNNGAR